MFRLISPSGNFEEIFSHYELLRFNVWHDSESKKFNVKFSPHSICQLLWFGVCVCVWAKFVVCKVICEWFKELFLLAFKGKVERGENKSNQTFFHSVFFWNYNENENIVFECDCSEQTMSNFCISLSNCLQTLEKEFGLKVFCIHQSFESSLRLSRHKIYVWKNLLTYFPQRFRMRIDWRAIFPFPVDS